MCLGVVFWDKAPSHQLAPCWNEWNLTILFITGISNKFTPSLFNFQSSLSHTECKLFFFYEVFLLVINSTNSCVNFLNFFPGSLVERMIHWLCFLKGNVGLQHQILMTVHKIFLKAVTCHTMSRGWRTLPICAPNLRMWFKVGELV